VGNAGQTVQCLATHGSPLGKWEGSLRVTRTSHPQKLDVIRHLDEGTQRTTRARLLTIEKDRSLFELLAESRYGDAMRQAAVSGSEAATGTIVGLSEGEWARRRPATPDFLLDAIPDRPEIEAMPARMVRPARRNQGND